MEKLLHERLRESEGDIVEGEGYSFFVLTSEANALADEIERYYIPRPRFEDGEPVPWGSQDIQWDDTDDYNPHDPWHMTAISSKGEPIATAGDAIVSRAEMTDGGCVKRHQPKVLDADGVEIKVGDTVWHIQSGQKFNIEAVGNDYAVSDDGIYIQPLAMTHKEPDSLEKLRDDISMYAACEGGHVEEDVERFADRLSAHREGCMMELAVTVFIWSASVAFLALAIAFIVFIFKA